jgi:hypothetical protein
MVQRCSRANFSLKGGEMKIRKERSPNVLIKAHFQESEELSLDPTL